MNGATAKRVMVQVVGGDQGRQIAWGTNVTEQLEGRMDEIRSAIAAGAQAVAGSLDGLPSVDGWHLGEVSASFGLTLTAEAGVILSKASAEATFEITVTFQHDNEPS